MYTPKHRGEPKFQVTMMESERGWGQEYWTKEFDTREEAEAYKAETNAKNISDTVPDYYVVALEVTVV